MEKYFSSSSELNDFLEKELGFNDDDACDSYMDMEDYSEEPHKRSTRCSGYILDTQTGYYYLLVFTSDYDWGCSDFYLVTEPLKMQEEIQTITVKKFVPIEKE